MIIQQKKINVISPLRLPLVNRLESLIQERFKSLENSLLEKTETTTNALKEATVALQNASQNLSTQLKQILSEQEQPLKKQIDELTKSLDIEVERRINLEATIKKNLRLYNIPESVPYGELMDYVLDILHQADSNVSAADIDLTHRYGQKQGKFPHPTVVTFASLKAKNLAFSKASSLRNLGFPVSADLPQEWVERRKKLHPFFIQAKRLLE